VSGSAPASPSQFAREVVALARLAPSVHNTQPWLWYGEGDVLELWADRERALDVLDPQGRQLVLSCGASLLHARLAVRGLGRDCTVELLPDPSQPEHLATLHVGGELAATPDELELAAAAPDRHTARGPFEARPVPEDARQRLVAAAEAEGAHLHLVPDEDRVVLAVLLAQAEEREAEEPEYREELRAWVRDDDSSPDGVPRLAASQSDVRSRATDMTLRDFGVHPAAEDSPGARPEVERPLLAVLLTDGDTSADWLAGGCALARVLLSGAAEGIAASPLNQVVDRPRSRALLQRELRLLSSPQMVLRMGYGSGPGAPRREVDDVLYVAPDR
jgi:hypothetical protein